MSGCPFLLSQAPVRNPFYELPEETTADPTVLVVKPDYPRPYISPYVDSFSKWDSTDFSALAFFLQNSLFHHEFVTTRRSGEHLAKVMVANELRESGNRRFSRGQYENALMCYEHALGLFAWVEVHDRAVSVVEVPEADPLNENARVGMVVQLLVNIASALIKLKHFALAERVLLEAATRSPLNPKVLLARCQLRLCNKESDVAALTHAMSDLQRAKTELPEASQLDCVLEQLLRNAYRRECTFYEKCLAETKSLLGTRPGVDSDFEFAVVKRLTDKYVHMLRHYREDPESLARVEQERREVQKTYSKMQWVLNLSPKTNLLQKHAAQHSLDLSEARTLSAFEATKRFQLPAIFNRAQFNKRLLYQCIQECMPEFEGSKVPEEEPVSWVTSVGLFIVVVLAMYWLSAPGPSVYGF